MYSVFLKNYQTNLESRIWFFHICPNPCNWLAEMLSKLFASKVNSVIYFRLHSTQSLSAALCVSCSATLWRQQLLCVHRKKLRECDFRKICEAAWEWRRMWQTGDWKHSYLSCACVHWIKGYIILFYYISFSLLYLYTSYPLIAWPLSSINNSSYDLRNF